MSDELEKALRQGAAKVAEGRFKLDARKALDRLKDHRFAQPGDWVLEVLRAAVASRARSVTVRIDSDDVEVRFDGRPFAEGVMNDLLSQALTAGPGDEEQRGRLLSLAVAGALGSGAKWVVVESGGRAMRVEPPAEVGLDGTPERGTRLHLRKKLTLGKLLEAVSRIPERWRISELARAYPLSLRVNEDIVEQDGEPHLSRRLDGGELHVWRSDVVLEVGELRLNVLGVDVSARSVTLPGVQLRARARIDGMRRNASGSDVVDNDPGLATAMAALEAESLREVEVLLEQLHQREDDDDLRHVLVGILAREKLDARAEALLVKAPLVPGPSGEWHPLELFRERQRNGQPIFVADRPYPEGTYPTPTVLLSAATTFPWGELIPKTKRVDVRDQVRVRVQAQERSAAWAAQESEAPTLGSRAHLAVERVSGKQVTGEVGLELGNSPAFVRLLFGGKFFQQGEVAALAPLRLRAAVDYQGSVPDSQWHTVPDPGAYGVAAGAIAEAFARAVEKRLAEAPLDMEFIAHARDWLYRWARLDRPSFARLPAWLSAAKLFKAVGNARCSLGELQRLGEWRYVRGHHGAFEAALDGKPVLMLDPNELGLLEQLGGKKLLRFEERLQEEREVRGRLSRREAPSLSGAAFKVEVTAPGITGWVGVPATGGGGLELTLLRDGFRLETVSLSPRYAHAMASVESAALTPDGRWKKAERDAAFDAVVNAVHEAERALCVRIATGDDTFEGLEPAPQRLLARFLVKELGSGQARAPELAGVLDAPLFETVHGRRSIAELEAALGPSGLLWVMGQAPRAEVPAEMTVVLGRESGEVLGQVLQRPARDASAELEAVAVRLRHEKLPTRELEVDGPGAAVALEAAGLEGVVSLGPLEGPRPRAVVMLRRRWWLEVELNTSMPLQICASFEDGDAAATELTPAQHTTLAHAVVDAQRRLVADALASLEAPGSSLVVAAALAAGLHQTLEPALGKALRAAPIYPCTDGVARSHAELSQPRTVLVSRKRIAGSVGGKPVVQALGVETAIALKAFDALEDVTGVLELDAQARAERARTPRVAAVALPGGLPYVRTFAEAGVEGQVGLVSDGLSRLELLLERKPLCVVEGLAIGPVHAVVNADGLHAEPGFTGVVHDAALDHVIDRVGEHARALADEALTGAAALAPDVLEARAPLLAAVAFWRSGFGKASGPGDELPVLRATDGRPLSIGMLKRAHGPKRPVAIADREGALLEPDAWVWRPREGEAQLAGKVGLKLARAEAALDKAEEVRTRARVAAPGARLPGTWRAPVTQGTVTGEVVLPARPEPELTVSLLREHVALETYRSEHPAGALAEVNNDALKAAPAWNKAKRTRAFADTLAAVEAALEGLLARRLAVVDGEDWRAWAMAALVWNTQSPKVLAGALPALPLFADLKGQPVTVGQVLAEHARTRRVAVAARPLSTPEGTLVLRDGPPTREALALLGVESEDVTQALERKLELEKSRQQRRLAQLIWPGEALVRLPVNAGGFRGELALSGDHGEVTLSKDGVAVCHLVGAFPLGVVGVLDHPGLPVDETWTQAQPTAAQRAAIDALVDETFLALVPKVLGLSDRDRHLALELVLRYLDWRGVREASQLSPRGHEVPALIALPLLRTVDRRWVDLRAVADEVLKQGFVPVMAKTLFRPDVDGALVLESEALDSPWLSELEAVLGSRAVRRVSDVKVFRAERAERDPPDGSSESRGLERLRKEARLLRAGALGQLTPEDLEDIRLTRQGGAKAVEYQAAKRRVLLDVEHPLIASALAELDRRPERLYVLLATIYGAINRALERVTDAHEAQLMLALAGYLASNPGRLEPRASAESDD